MKNNIIYLMVAVLMSVGFLSCDDFLTQSDPNNLNTDVFWDDLNDTEAGLVSTYAVLRRSGVINFLEETQRADMGWPGYGWPSPTRIENTLWYTHSYTNSHSSLEDKWADNYEGAFRANQVIAGLNNNIKRSDENAEDWDLQMGQAKFLRALYHFYLYTSFNEGKIIIRDFVPETLADFHQPVSPADSVFAFIVRDLKVAYDLLPITYDDTEQLGRATKGAAATILGLAYIYNDDFETARVYFDEVINDFGYELEQDITKMFTHAGEFNSESIFEISYSNTERTDITSAYNDDVLSNRYNDQSIGVNAAYVPAWLAFAYKSEAMDELDERNYWDSTYIAQDTVFNSIDPSVIDTIKDVEKSVKVLRYVPLRASAMVTIIEDEQTKYYIDYSVSDNAKPSWTNAKNVGAYGCSMYKKYTNHDILNDPTENTLPRGRQYSAKNVVLNRLSEVYLLQAECILKTDGNVQEALDLINDIRSRWGLVLLGQANGDINHTYNDSIYTQESLMNQIMFVEKPLELSAEGQAIRWNDLRRWGITKQRFQDLSNMVYYAVDYTYYSEKDGKEKTKKRNSIVDVMPSTANTYVVVDYEYDQTADLFDPAKHDYLPLPSTEIMNNPNIAN